MSDVGKYLAMRAAAAPVPNTALAGFGGAASGVPQTNLMAVSINEPESGDSITYGDTLTVLGTISRPGTVQLFLDGVLLGDAEVTGLLWSYDWLTDVGDVGEHSLTAVALPEDLSATTESVPVEFAVAPPIVPIVAVITAPLDGADYNEGDTIEIEVTVNVAGTVEVFVNGVSIGDATMVGLVGTIDYEVEAADLGDLEIDALATATVGGSTDAAPTVTVSISGMSGFNAVALNWMQDTTTPTLTGSAPNQYYVGSYYSRVRALLDGSVTSITAEAFAVSSGDRDTIGVWTTQDATGTDGWVFQLVTFTGYGAKSQQTFSIPAGSRLIDFTNNAYLTGISAASYSVELKPATVPHRFVVYGDSIAYGSSAAPSFLGFANLLRYKALGIATLNFSVAGSSIYGDTGNDTSAASIAAQIVARAADGVLRTVYIQKITNDFGLDYHTAATFQTWYGNIVDAVNALDPSIKFVCQTAFHRTDEATPQPVHGSTLAQFNSAVVAVAAARSSYVRAIDAYQAFTLGDLAGGDGLHPTQVPHAKAANWAREQLGQLNPITAAITAVATAAVTYVAPVTTLLSNFKAGVGVTSDGGTPNRVTIIDDQGSLGSTWIQGSAAHGPEVSTQNGHASLKFDPTGVVESLKPTLAVANWKFLHAGGFTGIWRLQRTTAADLLLIDQLTFSPSNTGVTFQLLNATRAVAIYVGNGSGTFAISGTSSSNAIPVAGTNFTLDVRVTQAGGLIARVDKSVVLTASTVGTLSTSNPTNLPWVGAAAGGASIGANMHLMEQQLHGPVSADTCLSDAALNALVDQMVTDWP